MMEKKNVINWKKLWEDFEKWFIKDVKKRCSECHHQAHNNPEWDEQQKKIQGLANAQVRKMMKK